MASGIPNMQDFRQTIWMRDVASPGVQRFEVKHPNSTIDIPDGSAVLWCYVDPAKLLAIVSKRSLFFPTLDKLGDQFAGRWWNRTQELIQYRDELWSHDRDDSVVEEDKRNDQRLNFPKLDSGWFVDETIQH